VWVSGSTSSLCAAGLGLLLGLGTATAVNAAADDLEEIVVTGSHIRGADVAGSKLIVISVEQIEASGYGRVGDVLATVPQNFNRANEAVGEPGFFNLNHGSEVQLRGLGVGTTLTLVNGQRQGASGWQGTFTDVSTIPVSTIERIKILPEGTSTRYGSDAIGGVVNILLRRNFEGIEARPRKRHRQRGVGALRRVVSMTRGIAWQRRRCLCEGLYRVRRVQLRPQLRGHRCSAGELRPGDRAQYLRRWLANTQFNLGVNIALDQRPPFVNQFDPLSGTMGYDAANATVLGRQVRLHVVKHWGQ